MSGDASPQRACDGARAGDAEDAHAPSTSSSVLWERRIEQSIFVDISDDESLNFSDVQGAFTVHLSQGSDAPESPKFTDNTELSGETEESSTESAESISNERSEHKNTRNKSTNPSIQTQRTAIKPISRKHEDDAINTSDEEHEELPYDGAHTNHKTKSKSYNLCESGAVMPIQDLIVGDTFQSVLASDQKATQDVAPPSAKPIQAATHITDFLLRHFSREELLNPCKMIDAETLPEISLMDSIDESVLNRVSNAPQVSSDEREKIQNKSEEPDFSTAEGHGLFEDLGKGTQEAASNCSDANMCIDDADTSRCSVDDEEEDEDNHPKQSCNSLDLSKADPKLTFSRTRSFSEMKYGQGQVHYPLPDFSKVAPKVKIPKGNGSVKPIGQLPTIPRVQSSPGILGKSPSSCTATADVISRVLEDSLYFSDKDEQAGLAHQLQAEYDRLIAKYTETENLIGQIHASSEPSVSINWNETICNNDNTKLTAKTPQAPTAGSGVEQRSLVQNSSPAQTDAKILSDGDRLTSELKDIINSFTQKVDEFKTCVQTMTMNVEEQQMVLKSMMEAQDQLERNYLTKREEHRALEMQNYMGISRNTGEFDPDREVEGQIFRIGMHLEDIKEQIDRNVCHLFYPPSSSSSTPSHPPCNDISPSSLHQSLHEESLFSISTVRQNMIENDEDEEEEDHNFILLQCRTFSTGYEEDNLTATQEEDYNEDFLTQTYTTASLQQALTHGRREEIRRSDEDLPDVGTDIIGPSVENPTTDQTQSFWSPGADSGFGSSDASRPNTGLSQTAANALSSAQSDDVISTANISDSDSEMSHSNVQTTISVTTRPPQSTVNNEQYEQLDTTSNYISQNAPLKGPKVEAASEGAAISIAEQMTERRRDIYNGKHHTSHDSQRPDRDTNSPSHCSCHNSEVILALQYEVSHLKRALEESLSHLPHMSRRLDYPNSRSHSERKHRGQNRTGSSRRVKTDSSHQRTEDWISSDTESNKRKVTDGKDSDHTLSFQRGLSPSLEPTHGHFSALSDRRSCRSSSKASVDTSQLTSGNHQRTSNGPTIHNTTADTRPTYSSAIYRPAMGNLFINSKKLVTSLPANPSHKPLLQVNYGSSYSLPAGFKVRDRESVPPVSSRRRSTQSDSALLPSNVFFQQTSQRTGARRRYTSREESIHKTLDKALQAAFLMKQTTEKMADALSADLAKAQLQRKIHNRHPINNRTARCSLLSLSTSQAH
nr:uncharacterized protein LOC129441538 isoform X2 [Misgurnus anguillicaudatus]